MADSLKFHRPVSANIGNYEIICSLSHSSLIPPRLSPIYSDESTRERRVFFLTPPRTCYKDNCEDN